MRRKLLTIEVTEDYHRQTKALAKKHGRTLKTLVLQALARHRDYLERQTLLSQRPNRRPRRD